MELKKIRAFLAPILTILLYAIIILVLATAFSFVFEVDTYFWTTTLIGIVIMVATTFIWLPTGVEKGKSVKKIINNTKIYNGRPNYIVNNQLFDEAEEFSVYKNEMHRKKIITSRLAKHLIKYETYEKYVAEKLNAADKKELEEYLATLTPKQLRLLERLKRRDVKFKKMEPSVLIIGKTSKERIVPKNREGLFKSFNLIAKILWGLMLGAFMAFIVIRRNEDFGISQIVQIVVWSFSIIFNIYSAIITGYNSIVKFRNSYMIEHANLCAEFFAFAGISVEEVDRSIFTLEQQENANKREYERDKVETIGYLSGIK